MLPKSRRIERKSFDYILKNGRRFNSPSFVLYLCPIDKIPTTAPSRFSFSVSKKVSRLATNRNKLRRRGYSVIRGNIKRIKPGFYCFFSYKKGYQTKFSLLEEEVNGLLSTALMLI